MIRVLIILVFFLNPGKSTAQEFTDTITIKNSFLTNFYSYKKIYLRSDGMHLLMDDIPSAKSELIKYDRNARVAGILYTIGFVTTIWALAPKTPDETQEALAYVAAISFVTAIPFSFIRDKHEKKAVLQYNTAVKEYNKYVERKQE